MATILLVDDDELLGDMLQRVLRRSGHEVVRAFNGKEALQLYDPENIALVLTDLVMPEKEGLELISELHRMHPEVKIIAMSGGGRAGAENYLPVAKHFGAVCTLRKPFSIEVLMKAVTEALNG